MSAEGEVTVKLPVSIFLTAHFSAAFPPSAVPSLCSGASSSGTSSPALISKEASISKVYSSVKDGINLTL